MPVFATNSLFGIPLYPLLISLSLLSTAGLTLIILKQMGLKAWPMAHTVTAITALGLFGARMLYVVLYPEQFEGRLPEVFNLSMQNFTLYVGLIGGAFGAWLMSKRYGYSFLKFCDRMVIAAVVGLLLSRLACLFNGCCYGKISGVSWAIPMVKNSPAYRAYIKGHPFYFMSDLPKIHFTQLYEIIVVMVAALITGLLAKWQKLKPRDGVIALIFALFLTIGRWVVYFFRAFPYDTDSSHMIRGPILYGASIIVILASIRAIYRGNS